MPGGCYPKHRPCGDPELVPSIGSDTFGQSPAVPAQNLSINLVDLRLVPWTSFVKPDGPNPPSYVKLPPPPVLYQSEAAIITACCDDPEILNSVSVLVPAGSFSSWVSQTDANQQVQNYWLPIMSAQVNCSEVTTNVTTGSSLGVVVPFTEEQSGGTWLSDPWDGDAYVENEFDC